MSTRTIMLYTNPDNDDFTMGSVETLRQAIVAVSREHIALCPNATAVDAKVTLSSPMYEAVITIEDF